MLKFEIQISEVKAKTNETELQKKIKWNFIYDYP